MAIINVILIMPVLDETYYDLMKHDLMKHDNDLMKHGLTEQDLR